MRNERGGMRDFLGLLVLVLILVVGHQIWIKRQAGEAPAPSASPATIPDTPGPSFAPQRVVIPSDPSVQPVQIPISPHAAALTETHQMIEQGKYLEAEAKLLALPADALTDLAVRMNVAILWNNLGVMRAKAEGIAAGMPAYRTAVSINPQNPAAYLNLVLGYWELKDPALTPEVLEEAMRLAPNDPMPHIIFAEMLIGRDDLANAASHLQHAKERVSTSPKAQSYLNYLITKIEKTQKAEQKFLARESSHFTVKFDGDENYAVWNGVLEILEEAYREIGQQLGYYPSKPILVVLHTKESFQSSTGGPAWADGLFDWIEGRIKVPTQGALTDKAWLTRVLRHEYVHALLHNQMGGHSRRIPTWLNEGLAMQLAGDPPPDIPALVRGQVTLTNLTHLEGPWGGLTGTQALVAYLEGNSATKYLIDRFGMGKVQEILGVLATGQPIAAAMQDRLFISYDEFQRRWTDELNEKMKTGRM
jgi:tetratricopeptide (TPR) repeat protein